MALDGMFMFKLAKELNAGLSNTRIDKIYQPSKDELIFVMRGFNGMKKLYFNCRPDCARVHITQQNFTNPKQPPMLCMLLRKRFCAAKFICVTQDSLERVLTFNFEGSNELGDKVNLKIVCEIMGRYSNVIFLDNDNCIIDSVKRVGAGKSSVREILPGKKYSGVPPQDKLSLIDDDTDVIAFQILKNENSLLSKSILNTVKGISPLLSREAAYSAYNADIPVYDAAKETEPLKNALNSLKLSLLNTTEGCIVSDGSREVEFSFLPITQYGSNYNVKFFASLSELLDEYYKEKSIKTNNEALNGELIKLVDGNIEKLSKKIILQSSELKECEDCEALKIYGELINANLFMLKKGESVYALENFYTGETVNIPADPRLTPSENAQKYYKKYRKAQTAKVVLKEQIQLARDELDYLESVKDLLQRANLHEESESIREELRRQGYIKKRNGKRDRNPKPLKPYKFITSGGFTVLVGRNNFSNDALTFKTAKGNDLWFHTKNIHGSHTVLFTEGKDVPDDDVVEAAEICAYNSKGRNSSGVPVDYTKIKFVKRQQNYKPGKVFYTDYKTVYVTPDENSVSQKKRAD